MLSTILYVNVLVLTYPGMCTIYMPSSFGQHFYTATVLSRLFCVKN